MIDDELVTREQYNLLQPWMQGYIQYAQGGHVASELRDIMNTYAVGTQEHNDWHRGQFQAMLDSSRASGKSEQIAQDSEE